MSALGAISWKSGGVQHSGVVGLGFSNIPYMNKDCAGFASLGGYLKQISAGLDAAGNPEIWGIGGDNAVYVNDNGAGWVDLGGYATAISAAANSTAYVRGSDVDNVYISQAGAHFKPVGSIPLADPSAGAAYSPAPASALLFNNNQPSYLDMVQGAVGDCWLDASLAEVAARDPQDIKNMFVYDGTTVDNGSTVGLYSVRYFSPDGVAFYIQVDTALPSGGNTYNHVANALGTQALWPALAEKAYAEANALGLVNTGAENQGSYASLNNGYFSWSLPAITGNPESDFSINPTNIATAWNAGELIVLTTTGKTPTSSYIVGSHCYAVVGYNASSNEPFEVFNPWGTNSSGWVMDNVTGQWVYGQFYANAAFLSQNFNGQSFGTGAANGRDIDRAIEELTELAAFGDGHSPSGTNILSRYGLSRRQ
jgi:hypothetical protein